jgi:hypothetical protein
MKHFPPKIFILTTITPVFVAVILRIIEAVISEPSSDGLLMLTLVILGLIGLYAVIIYLLYRPHCNRLTGFNVGIGIIILATSLLVGGIIHLFRFVFSPEAEARLPWSLVNTGLYLLAGTSAYCLLLWFIWSIWRSKNKS